MLSPLRGREGPGQTVDRDDPLGGLGVPVDSEGDVLVRKEARDRFLNAAGFLAGEPTQGFIK